MNRVKWYRSFVHKLLRVLENDEAKRIKTTTKFDKNILEICEKLVYYRIIQFSELMGFKMC